MGMHSCERVSDAVVLGVKALVEPRVVDQHGRAPRDARARRAVGRERPHALLDLELGLGAQRARAMIELRIEMRLPPPGTRGPARSPPAAAVRLAGGGAAAARADRAGRPLRRTSSCRAARAPRARRRRAAAARARSRAAAAASRAAGAASPRRRAPGPRPTRRRGRRGSATCRSGRGWVGGVGVEVGLASPRQAAVRGRMDRLSTCAAAARPTRFRAGARRLGEGERARGLVLRLGRRLLARGDHQLLRSRSPRPISASRRAAYRWSSFRRRAAARAAAVFSGRATRKTSPPRRASTKSAPTARR